MRHAAASAAIALLVAGSALADGGPDRVSVLLGSYHASPGQEFEEFNPGVFLTWNGDGAVDTTAGLFRNSYGRLAPSVTFALPFYEREHIELAGFLGAAYYPDDGRRFRYHLGDVIPLGGLQARLGPAFFQVIPGDGDEADAVFTFGVTMPLGQR